MARQAGGSQRPPSNRGEAGRARREMFQRVFTESMNAAGLAGMGTAAAADTNNPSRTMGPGAQAAAPGGE